MSSTTLTFAGAAGAVTGSCTLVEHGSARFLIDCGTVQGEVDTTAEFPFDPRSVDALFLTHGHLDHTGRIPELVAAGFDGAIYGHYATCDIAKILWRDSLRMSPIPPSARDIAKAEALLFPVAYGVPVEKGNAVFTLHDAGHILGSAHVSAELGRANVLFSGDIGRLHTPIIRDPFTGWEKPFDAVVIESTYGNRLHGTPETIVAQFEALLTRTVQARGVLLIPAFAIGRTQEILYHLNTLVDSGRVPRLPVYIDSPMAALVTSVYRRNRDCYDTQTRELIERGDMPLEFPGLHFVENDAESRRLDNASGHAVIVAGSGMCTGGRIVRHIATFASRESTTILFCGYQAAGTMGRALLDRAPEVAYEGRRVEVRCDVARLSGLSAHADRDELLAWAGAVPGRAVRWFVNHGERDAAGSLADGIEGAGMGHAVAVHKGLTVKL